ncbi:hypothetical protein BV25DRAFT_237713 [Artomyces pyxidatus]|uniref:Uncharacterized protein n=1 Tax=Artomyces pyxidatus TaxID=48021 RepID=A0ACB8T6G3_9AGAM|nr:hypothetical protein BV25DRAFT_237713 [Artomyces pyxidatus]
MFPCFAMHEANYEHINTVVSGLLGSDIFPRADSVCTSSYLVLRESAGDIEVSVLCRRHLDFHTTWLPLMGADNPRRRGQLGMDFHSEEVTSHVQDYTRQCVFSLLPPSSSTHDDLPRRCSRSKSSIFQHDTSNAYIACCRQEHVNCQQPLQFCRVGFPLAGTVAEQWKTGAHS